MIIPAGFNVLVQIKPIKNTTDAGIQLVLNEDRERQNTNIGTLLAIGPNAWKAFDDGQPWAKVGDQVVWAAGTGRGVQDPDDIANQDYFLLVDRDILAVLTKSGE